MNKNKEEKTCNCPPTDDMIPYEQVDHTIQTLMRMMVRAALKEGVAVGCVMGELNTEIRELRKAVRELRKIVDKPI